MSAKDYFIGNLAIIFSDAPYIYISASLSDISKVENSSSNFGVWYYVIIGFSIIIAIVVIILVYYFSKNELLKTLKKIEEEKKKKVDNDNQNLQRSGSWTRRDQTNKESTSRSHFSVQENENESKSKDNKSVPSVKGDRATIHPIPENAFDLEEG